MRPQGEGTAVRRDKPFHKRWIRRRRSRPLDTTVECSYTYIMIADQGLMECGDCLCLASRRAARGLTRAFDRQLRPHGIRATQFSILTMLLMRGPLRIGELAEYLGLERTTLTRNLAVIEEKGWVAIRPADDARARVVAATKKGYAAVTAARAAWRKAQQAALATIGNAGVNALHALARRI
jgi:DNA-binding MarR family transcriptional regulator